PDEAAQENARLRAELAAATDYVHSLVALNHSQVEQLRDAQEEAQSSTEEFRSTNEELQTAKEEVDSTNEELVTINEELRAANTELAKASASLRTSGDLTSAIIETMRYPLLVLSAGLRVESANQAFLAAFGVGRTETIGRLVYDLGNGQWNIPELRRLLEDILPNNSTFDDFEVTHDFAKIGPMTMLLNARRLEGGDDNARLIVLVIADITARARASLALQDTAVEQLRSNAELEQFAAVASHDLQEPLRMMASYIGLLQARYAPLFDERAREYMANVTNGAKRLTGMIDAILTYSRLGQEDSGVTDIDSAYALRNALANLESKIAVAHAIITHDPLPIVQANREQLTQLFQNLLGNSVKYGSPQRPPLIRVSASEKPQEWVFAIVDNGIGMAEEDFTRIFEPFTRVHTKGKVQGSGIGLATCKKIVDHHRGRIWVESKLGVGSTFFFSLPKRGAPAV
ncbi:MAG: PAS domain-containing protein, partial [Planctomycetes bacterium]|nr:PAS domain-containing protein [Planctomycetota bacterium]